MALERIGTGLMLLGLILLLVGGLLWLVGRFLPDLSRIPGTIRIEGGGVTCIFPLLASIVLSLILTVLLNVIARLLNR
ncbi:DUF2905 domain-containing protein [Anaerolinea sp.]|uniref:DUF2905 domain-containing protein n=1 Tax=Anaerolinea sp. TaxID=1872519 RepID=UPI002ACD5B38|nr:DUF2905 domain-containing protein [Anaerolinea sp.]